MDLMCSVTEYNCSINDLPDEVLEYILSLLPPYNDLEQCMRVSKRWRKNVENVIIHTNHNLLRSLVNFDIKWENVTPTEKFQSITKRYSHSACCYENSMYVFGGCTCTSTTFNDLWRLDLSTRKWSRLLTMGTYPSPKACATLVHYKGSLLLFGGWTHPSAYPLHQAWRTFNELHLYDIGDNRWQCVTTPTSAPPPMAGHSATVHNDNMVIFGGLQGQSGSSNDVWCFNLLTHMWTKQNVTGTKPQSRYGQSQIALDDNHLLILGGCGGGPNMVLNDVWLLDMRESVWSWKPVAVRNAHWAASHLWCHPACRVGHYIVVFSRNPVALAPMFTYSKWSPNGQLRSSQANLVNAIRDSTIPQRRTPESVVVPPVDKDVNVNGGRGSLTRAQPTDSQTSNPSPPIEDQGPSSLPCTLSSSSSSSSSTCSSTESSSFPSPVEDVDISSVLIQPANDNQDPGGSSSKDGNLSRGPSNSTRPNDGRNSSTQKAEHSRSTNEKRSPHFSRASSGFHSSRSEFFSPSVCNSGMAAFRDTTQSACTSSRYNNRERQLEALRRVEERIRNKVRERPVLRPLSPKKESPPPVIKTSTPKMAMFVLDISYVLTDECYVTWLPVKSVAEGCPEDMILYSLVPGNGELIMFGGIQQDAMFINQPAQSSLNITNVVSNSLHFITAPRSVI